MGIAVTAISVLGVDLGKNLCSVVGLDAAGAVVNAAQGEARDPDRACGEAPSVHRRDGGLLRISSARTWTSNTRRRVVSGTL